MLIFNMTSNNQFEKDKYLAFLTLFGIYENTEKKNIGTDITHADDILTRPQINSVV